MISEVSAYEQMFGRPTGRHSHPDTHPWWMEFTAETCPRKCGAGVEAIKEASK